MRRMILIFMMVVLPQYIVGAEKLRTVGGTLRIVEKQNDPGMKRLMLNNRTLKKYEYMNVSFEKHYRLRNSTLVIISEDMGGSGTTPSYYFLEIFPSGKTRLSGPVDSSDYTFKPIQIDKDTVKVDLGYDKGKQKFATYQQGRLSVGTESSSGVLLSAKECKWLYKTVYRPYTYKANPCNERVGYIIGNGPYHGYYSITQNPDFSEKDFKSLLYRSCKKREPISYSLFQKRVCGY